MSSFFPSFAGFMVVILPVLLVWVVGILVALFRWQRHPRVSAIIVFSLVMLMLASLGHRWGALLIISNDSSSGFKSSSMAGLYLSMLGLISSLFRAAAWMGILVAIFAWRDNVREGQSSPPLQFSIRGLLVLTLVVAVLCAAVRGLITLLGDSALFLLGLMDEVPLVICWLIGLYLAISRWQLHPDVSKQAALGIGMSIAVMLLWQEPWDFLMTAILSLLAATAWVFVLIAVFGWRASTGELPDREIAAR
jgi:hypothetical protein